MMPTSSNNTKKKKLTTWWRKIFHRKKQQQTISKTQNWRNLSPDEPPLPFLLNKLSSEAVKNGSELAPIPKDASKDDFPSLYLIQPSSSSSRELYTIPELSEMNTTRSNSTANNTMKSNTSVISTSALPPPLPSEEQGVTRNEDEDLFVSPLRPQPSSSSLRITPVLQEQMEQPQQQSMVLIVDDDDENEAESAFRPISEWPSLDTCQQKVPHFKESLQGNELESKLIFSRMLQSAYKYHQLFYKKKNEGTKEMHLIFDEKNNIGGITFIMENGMREDYLQFGGMPQYIPPELSTCATYNHEMADVWALGVSLYRMLVGKYPFSTEGNHKDLFRKMLHFDYRIPPTLSDDAKDLLRRMLAPENTRASLDLILFHPWIKSCTEDLCEGSQQKVREKRVSGKKSQRKRDRVLNMVKKAIRLVFLGPYPPPKRDDFYRYYTQQQPRRRQT